MSAVTGSLSINNGADTPVAKTFAPQRVSPQQSVFTERTAESSAGFISLSIGLDSATSARKTNRVDIAVDLPVLQITDGVSSVAYTGRFKGYFVIPDVMTSTERKDLHAYVANALDNALIKGVVRDLDPLY